MLVRLPIRGRQKKNVKVNVSELKLDLFTQLEYIESIENLVDPGRAQLKVHLHTQDRRPEQAITLFEVELS